MSVKIPGPPELLPGCPDAIIDLQTPEGAALTDGQWRYSDTRVRRTGFVSVGPELGPSGPPKLSNTSRAVSSGTLPTRCRPVMGSHVRRSDGLCVVIL